MVGERLCILPRKGFNSSSPSGAGGGSGLGVGLDGVLRRGPARSVGVCCVRPDSCSVRCAVFSGWLVSVVGLRGAESAALNGDAEAVRRRSRISGLKRARLVLVGDAKDGRIRREGDVEMGGMAGVCSVGRAGGGGASGSWETRRRFGADSSMLVGDV